MASNVTNPILRVGCVNIPPLFYMQEGVAKGPLAEASECLRKYAGLNVTYIVFDEYRSKADIGSTLIQPGTILWATITGDIDVSGFNERYEIPLSDSIGYFTPTTQEMGGTIFSSSLILTDDVPIFKVENAFDVFSREVILMSFVIFTILCLCHAFTRHRFGNWIWFLVSRALRQNETTQNIFLLIYSFAAFLGVSFWINSLRTNLVVNDGGDLLDQLDDIVYNRKVMPNFDKESALTAKFILNENPDSVYYKIWERAKRIGLEKCLIPEDLASVNEAVKLGVYDPNRAFIGDQFSVQMLKRMACNIIAQRVGNFKNYPWVARNSFGSALYAYIMSKSIDPHVRSKVDHGVERVLQAGIYTIFKQRAINTLDAETGTLECLMDAFRVRLTQSVVPRIRSVGFMRVYHLMTASCFFVISLFLCEHLM